jgi:hypothetical protein
MALTIFSQLALAQVPKYKQSHQFMITMYFVKPFSLEYFVLVRVALYLSIFFTLHLFRFGLDAFTFKYANFFNN